MSGMLSEAEIEQIRKWAGRKFRHHSDPMNPYAFVRGCFTYSCGCRYFRVFVDHRGNVTEIILPDGGVVKPK